MEKLIIRKILHQDTTYKRTQNITHTLNRYWRERKEILENPQRGKNLQTSYNDAEVIFQDIIDDYVSREFRGFALVLILIMRWYVEVIGVETTFLHGEMEEWIYMNLPEGLNLFEGKKENDVTDCVIQEKYIYGTIQAAC